MDDILKPSHISLRVESSFSVTRQPKAGHLVESVVVVGEVLTPPHMAKTKISLLILWPDELSASAENEFDDGDLEGALLLCTDCVPQYAGLQSDSAKPVISLTENGLPRWMANKAFPCGTSATRRMMYGMARVTVAKAQSPDQRSRAHIDILRTHLAQQLHSLSDMRNFFNEHMSGQFDGAEQNANCLIQLVSQKTNKTLMLWLYSARLGIQLPADGDRPARAFNVPGDAQMAWNEAVTTGTQAKGLAKMLASVLSSDLSVVAPEHADMALDLQADIRSGDVVVEAIPGERVRIVGDSLDRLIFPDEFPDSSLALTVRNSEIFDHKTGNRIQGFLPMHINALVKPPEPNAAFPFATVVASRFYAEPGSRPVTAQRLEISHV